jgi:hypothetical protein
LDLFSGGMADLDRLAALHPRAALAMRAQPGEADLAGEAHVRGGVAEPDDLVEQGTRPQVRVVVEAGNDIGPVVGEGVGAGWATNARHPLTGQIGAHRLAVTPEMAGDGRDGPPPFGQSISFHVFSH